MDIEFHYYITYLLAARAGFAPEQARIIAHASQYVDDNTVRLSVAGAGAPFRSRVTQTLDITRPEDALFRIYACFHFLPGDPTSRTAWRRDGAMSWLNTTPDSKNARRMAARARDSGDLYRLGIACHTYADTWAHQNFLGYWDDFNALRASGDHIPPVGHAPAGHAPDEPGRVWEDDRLIDPWIDNSTRFLDAAQHLLRWLWSCRTGEDMPAAPVEGEDDLLNALADLFAEEDRDTRTAGYRALAERPRYGGTPLPEYDRTTWLNEAVSIDYDWLLERVNLLGMHFSMADIIDTECRWRDPDTHRDTPWYRFQQAARGHQADVLALLRAPDGNLHGLDIPAF